MRPQEGKNGASRARVVLAAEMRRNERPVPLLGISLAVGVGPDLLEPVLGRPVAGVPPDQLVEDSSIDLPPRRRGIAHESDGVGGIDQVESVPAQHRRVASVIPVRMRPAVAIPAVRCRGLAPEVAEPPDAAL